MQRRCMPLRVPEGGGARLTEELGRSCTPRRKDVLERGGHPSNGRAFTSIRPLGTKGATAACPSWRVKKPGPSTGLDVLNLSLIKPADGEQPSGRRSP